MQEGKWLSEEALQIATERREGKDKGERERYIQLNAEFQRRARSDKKALDEQCKEIEENSRMGKTWYLFKEIGGIRGTFRARMGTVKDRNGEDLTAEETEKKWQEYTEELYRKGFNDPDNHEGVVTHLELDNVEYEVK